MNLADYCRQCVMSSQKNSDHLLLEWNLEKNGAITPQSCSYASHQKVWWQCRNGHEWQGAIRDRTLKEAGCPYCSGKKVWPGYNDLADFAPSVAAEWHPKKNETLMPGDVTPGSEKKVWWQCKEGHEWQATVENRVLKGNGCPYCSGKRAWPGYNDLKTLYPKLAGQWHPTLNQGISPAKVRPGSGKKIWWICPDGHVWQARIFSRTSKTGSGCPVCAGNVKKRK